MIPNFRLDWPTMTLQMFEIISTVTSNTSYAYSFGCYTDSTADQMHETSVILAALSPFVIVLIAALFWIIHY